MYKDLPEPVKKQVASYLKSNNFIAAKAMHDAWLDGNVAKQNKESVTWLKRYLCEDTDLDLADAI